MDRQRGRGGRRGGKRPTRRKQDFKSNPSTTNNDRIGKKRTRTMDIEGNSRSKKRPQLPSHTLLVSGYNESTQSSLVHFLQSQLNVPFGPARTSFLENRCFLVFQEVSQAQEYVKLDGIHFGGNMLDIHFVKDRKDVDDIATDSTSMQQSGMEMNARDKRNMPLYQQSIVQHGQACFDLNQGLLDLSCLSNQPTLNNVRFKWNDPQFWNDFFSLCASNIPANQVTAINLTGNQLRTLEPMNSMLKHFPSLSHLMLSDNALAFFSELDYIQSESIQSLWLFRNPICDDVEPAIFAREVCYRFPNLIHLNDQPVHPSRFPTVSPPPYFDVAAFYLDNESTKNIAEAFITKYFRSFDQDRETSLTYYSRDSYFSYVINYDHSSLKQDPRADINPFIEHSRNLLSVPDSKVNSNLYSGTNRIQTAFQEFPETQHDLATPNVDAFVLNSAGNESKKILISVHGTMHTPKSTFSFDRSFLLAPARDAFAVIVNDELTLRPQSLLWTDQAELIQHLCKETRMNPYYSEMCLVANFWEYDQALADFHRLNNVGDLPPDAFVA